MKNSGHSVAGSKMQKVAASLTQLWARYFNVVTVNLEMTGMIMHLSMSSPRGGGSGNPREFDCDAYPQGGDFDQPRSQDLYPGKGPGNEVGFWPDIMHLIGQF